MRSSVRRPAFTASGLMPLLALTVLPWISNPAVASTITVPSATGTCGVNNPNGARFHGNCGAQVSLTSGSPAYVQENGPSGEAAYRVRFYANLRLLTMSNGQEMDLFAAYYGAETPVGTASGNQAFRLVVEQVSGVKWLTAYARTDGGSDVEIPAPIQLAPGWRAIEVSFVAGAGNGELRLWVDGFPRTPLSGLDNDTRLVNYARWGGIVVPAGAGGSFELDDFTSQRTSYIGPVQPFSDVPIDGFWPYVQGLYQAEITTGCAVGSYCLHTPVTRAEMAVFLIRGVHQPTFVPPAPTGDFADVPVSYWAAPQIEQLLADGITTGCAANPLRYCPGNNVNRAEMAVFLLRAKHGSSYTPPPATGTVFSDVSAGFWAAAWIEQLAAEGITTGCGPGVYCPNNSVTRLEMAIFLTRTFSLPIPQVGP